MFKDLELYEGILPSEGDKPQEKVKVSEAKLKKIKRVFNSTFPVLMSGVDGKYVDEPRWTSIAHSRTFKPKRTTLLKNGMACSSLVERRKPGAQEGDFEALGDRKELLRHM